MCKCEFLIFFFLTYRKDQVHVEVEQWHVVVELLRRVELQHHLLQFDQIAKTIKRI